MLLYVLRTTNQLNSKISENTCRIADFVKHASHSSKRIPERRTEVAKGGKGVQECKRKRRK